MARGRINRTKLIVIVFGAFLLAIIIGEMAVFLFSNPSSRNGFSHKASGEGMKCGSWGIEELSETVFPSHPGMSISFKLVKVSIYGDYILRVKITNNYNTPVNLDDVLGKPSQRQGDMVFILFDRYGNIDRKTLVVREESRIIGARDSVTLDYKLQMSVTNPVYAVLVAPKASIRIGQWVEPRSSLSGVCKAVSWKYNGVRVVERWATLVEGLTVMEAYVDASKASATVSITGSEGLSYNAVIKDPSGETVQVLSSVNYNTPTIKVERGILVLGVSAGQIRGEPSRIEVNNTFKVNGNMVPDYKGSYSNEKWPSSIPGKWVAGFMEKNLSNGLKASIEYAYNGYIFVVKGVKLANPSPSNASFYALVNCSPIAAYPLPAVRVDSSQGRSAWLPLSVPRNLSSLGFLNGTQALKVIMPPGYSVNSTGWAIVVLLYEKQGEHSIKLRFPWCEDVNINVDEVYK